MILNTLAIQLSVTSKEYVTGGDSRQTLVILDVPRSLERENLLVSSPTELQYSVLT